MIPFTDIIKSVTKTLKQEFNLPVYGDEVKEGYKTPSFFVGIVPISSTTETKNYINTELTITISYFSNVTDTAKNYKTMYDIKKLFGITLNVNDRCFTINDSEIAVTGEDMDIYQFNFNVTYKELVNFDKEEEVARELIHKYRKVVY